MEKTIFKSPEELLKGQEEIQRKIFERAKVLGLSNEGLDPILDGVSSIAGYCQSSPRIMWILKQPYDDQYEGKPAGGGWTVYGAFEDGKAYANRTWRPMAYCIYGIRTHEMYKEMPDISDEKSMVELLKDIAYINVCKMPGYKRTFNVELEEAYELWKDIIEEQIRLYDPQVICFANTMWLFKKDWGIDENTEYESISLGNDKYMLAYKKDGRLFLDTYHPNQRVVKRENYVDAIINAVNDFLK